MRILIVGINYRPELTGIGPYTAGLAEHLAARGDAVTVITGLPHYPGWRIPPGTPCTLHHESQIGGVRVIRAAHFVPRTQDAVRRAVYEGTFGLTGLLASRHVHDVDAIVGIVPSLSGGVLARLLGQRLGAPYGLLFQDLMGPAARQSGMSGGGVVARATTAAERFAAGGACAIGVITPSFVPYIHSLGVPDDAIVHVPNWSRLADADLPVAAVRARFGWTDGLQVVLHAGNIGLKQGLEQVVNAASLAAERGDPVRFVFSGDGNQSGAIRAMARRLGNVDFLGLQPDGMHASLLAAADVLLLCERQSQITMSFPSKLTSYFAAGRPIVAAIGNGGCSAAEVVRSGAGMVVSGGRAESLLDALAHLRREPALAATLAAAGPVYADAHTSADACLAQGAALIDRIATGRTASCSVPTTAA